MPIVRVLKAHVSNGVVHRVGTVYSASESQAAERVRVGLVEFIQVNDVAPPGIVNKVEYGMYAPRQFTVSITDVVGDETDEEPQPERVHVLRRAGSWWFFSDDTKVLGQSAAAQKLGLTVEEFMEHHAAHFS
jgi:hypothetical protein